MRLKRASLTFAGAAAAVAVTTMAASPAWACNDRDPKLQLHPVCGAKGAPNWQLENPNTFAVPATWQDDKGGHSAQKINVPARSSVTLLTHATKVVVTAYRIDQRDLPVWQNHGAVGALLSCKPAKPGKPTMPTTKPTEKPPAPKPTATSEAPKPAAPSGEARPATPVDAQPNFTG